MESKRTPGQQQVYDSLRREFYRERMRKYDEEYYAAREKREEKESEEEARRLELLQREKEAAKKRDKIIGLLFLVGIILLIYHESGWFDPYWERFSSIYDTVSKEWRCIVGGQLTGTEPCLGITLAGQNAREKYEARCIRQGGKKCDQESWDWLYSYKPKK